MILFEYLKGVNYEQDLELYVLDWEKSIPYGSKQFVPYNLLLFDVVMNEVCYTVNGNLLIPIEKKEL